MPCTRRTTTKKATKAQKSCNFIKYMDEESLATYSVCNEFISTAPRYIYAIFIGAVQITKAKQIKVVKVKR